MIYSKSWHLPFSGDNDFSGSQKFHNKSVPRIGGLAIFIGFSLGFAFLAHSRNSITQPCFYILSASLPVLIAGLTEDLTKIIGVKWRLISAFSSGLIFTWLFDIQVIQLDIIILDSLLQSSWITIIFLSFAIAGLVNAYNIIGGFNGLSSMVAIISFAAILFVGTQVNDELVITLALMSIGAISGFFRWNYPRGLIFLGDSGAYLIGFSVASLSVLLIVRNGMVSPWFALMVNAYPTLETLFTIWRRTVRQRRNVGLPDRLHLHSLIYRRIIFLVHREDEKLIHHYVSNSETSPYLWILSSISIISAVLWWNSSIALMVCAVGFVLLYLHLYRKIVRFQMSVLVDQSPIKF